MEANDVNALLHKHFGSVDGFDANGANQLASTVATASSAIAQHAHVSPNTSPTPEQQACYATCQKTRDEALAAAALKGWPGGTIAAAAAIFAFNACRHSCDP